MRTKVYRAWGNAKQRCVNPKDSQYKNYGARGITMDPKYDRFEAFYKDVGDPPTQEHTLERIDNNKNYEPGNLRWATRSEQARNKINSRYLELNGVIKGLPDWCDEYKIARSVVRNRLRLGWNIQEALCTPLITRYKKPPPKRTGLRRLFRIGEDVRSFRQWFLHYGITPQRFIRRIQEGMTPREALVTPVSGNKLGYKGVTWKQDKQRYCAKILIRGKMKYLGYFHTPEEAHEAYLKAKSGI